MHRPCWSSAQCIVWIVIVVGLGEHSNIVTHCNDVGVLIRLDSPGKPLPNLQDMNAAAIATQQAQ